MEGKDYRLAAILYTDIAGFSKPAQADGPRARELAGRFESAVRIAAAARGASVAEAGDGAFLLDFRSGADALLCVLDLRLSLDEAGAPALPARFGLHLGDIAFSADGASGEGVDVARALCASAAPGSARLSSELHGLVQGKVAFRAQALGSLSLPGVGRAVSAYEISAPAPAAAAQDAGAMDAAELRDSLKRRILADIKAAGTRPSAASVLARYASEGPHAAEVVEKLAAAGFLVRRPLGLDDAIPADPNADWSSAPAAHSKSAPAGVEWAGYAGRWAEKAERWQRKAERKAERRALRREERNARRGYGKWDGAAMDGPLSGADKTQDFESYSRRVREEARSAKFGFVGHLISYAGVNAALCFINYQFSPGFPWALFPLGGWGIGILEHYVSTLRKGDRARELAKVPYLEGDALDSFKRLQRAKDALAHNWASTLSVSAFLAMVNLITGSHFPWAAIPAAFMGVGTLAHTVAYLGKKSALESSLVESLGLKGSWARALRKLPAERRSPPADYGRFAASVAEARALRDELAGLAAGVPGGASSLVDEGFVGALDAYVEQVTVLAARIAEVDSLVELIPARALAADRERMEARVAGGVGAGLEAEYRASIDELRRQEQSFAELGEQREVLELRLGSALTSMKQLRIDLARAADMAASGGSLSLDSLRGTTDDLNRRVADLRSGYEELEALEARALLPGGKTLDGEIK